MPRSIVIVASRYNPEYVDALVENARKEIAEISPSSSVELMRVPGAYEIPLAVQRAARAGCDAVIAFGVIIEGATAHASLIGAAVTEALLRISLETNVPVIHEVLLVKSAEQARQRCIDAQLNRGVEAARTAMQMAQPSWTVESSINGNG